MPPIIRSTVPAVAPPRPNIPANVHPNISRLNQSITAVRNSPEVLANNKKTSKNLFASLLSGIANVFGTSIEEKNSIIGQTVHPAIANKTIYAVRYDGYGVIRGIEGRLKRSHYHLIINNLIKPLSETHVYDPNKIRTPVEALIDIAALLEKSTEITDTEKIGLRDNFKAHYLSGGTSKQTLITLHEIIALKFGTKCPQLVDEIQEITDSIAKEFHITKHNDNYYGRLFDTELSKYIVEHPTNEMLNACCLVANRLLVDFESYDTTAKAELCRDIAKHMTGDNAPWRATIEEANRFLETGADADFVAMLKTTNKFQIPLVLSIAVKYICSAPGFDRMLNEATALYHDVILQQRSLNRLENSTEIGRRYGILLPYQKKEGGNINFGDGVRPIDRYKLPTADLTEHNQEALIAERAIGIGMSGSANILNYLFLDLQRTHEIFPREHAQLMAAAHLTFSGGHSINEAYSVFGYKSNQNFKPLSYQSLSESTPMSSAVEYAYNQVLSMSQRLNENALRNRNRSRPITTNLLESKVGT